MERGLSLHVFTVRIKPSLQQELDNQLAGEPLVVFLVQEAVAGDRRAAGHRQVEETLSGLGTRGEISHLSHNSEDITFLLR